MEPKTLCEKAIFRNAKCFVQYNALLRTNIEMVSRSSRDCKLKEMSQSPLQKRRDERALDTASTDHTVLMCCIRKFKDTRGVPEFLKLHQ